MNTKQLFKRGVNLLTLSSFLVWNLAVATPEGGSVAQGSASISQSGSTTTINQSTQNAVINWHSFDTASNEAVQFNQPNASSIALNRITSGVPTSFAGQLTANGNVWILNPAGVLFTSTSKVDVAGLVASTLNMSDSNFMAGNYKLEQMPGFSQGSVINNGLITSHQNGLVALVAPTVENNGTIVANMGNVLLASGTVATLDPYGDDLINFAPNNYAVEGSVKNTGSIKTNGGKVVIAANSVNNIIKDVVNNGGIIEARNIAQGADGVIILGGNSGTTNIGGKITSNKIIIKGHDTKIKGELKTEQPGMIETSGETITIDSSAVIDAGKGGLWYMDPLTINLSDYGSVIQQQLSSGTNVTIATGTNPSIPGAGVINADVALSWDTSATLLLAAYGNINVTQPINIYGTGINGNGSGMIILRPNVTGTNPSVVNFSGSGVINTNTYGQMRLFYDPPAGYASPIDYSPYLAGNANYGSNKPYMMIQNQTQFDNLMSLAAGATQYTGVLTYNYNLNTNVNYGGSGPMFITYGGVFDGHNYVTGVNSSITGVTINTAWAGIMGTFAAAMNGGRLANTNFYIGTIDNLTSGSQEVGGVVGDMYSSSMSNVSFNGNITISSGGIVGGIVGGMQNSTLDNVQYGSGLMQVVIANAAGGIVGADYDVNIVNQGIVASGVSFIIVSTGSFGFIMGAVQGPNYTVIANSYVFNPGGSNSLASPAQGGFVGALRSGSVLYLQNSYVDFTNFIVNPPVTFDVALGVNENGGTNNVDTFGNTNYYTPSVNCGGVFPCSNNLFPFVQYFGSNPFTPYSPVYPSLPTVNLGAGVLSSASSQGVSVYADSTLIASPTSNGSGLFTFYYDPNLNPSFFTASTSGTVTGITIKKFAPQSYSPLAGMNINNNALTVVSDLVNPVSNSDLAALSYPAYYSVSGNDLTLASGISFFTTSETAYSLDGNILAASGSVTFGGPVTVDANSTVTSGGNITFGSTVDGAYDLTADAASGAVTFNGAVGGGVPLASLAVVGNAILGGNVTTVNGQTYFGPVTLITDVVVNGAGINFVNTVDGDGVSPRSLTVNSSSYTYFQNDVGSIAPLNILDVNSAFNIYILGSQMNAAYQEYSNVTTNLDAPTVLFSNGLNPTTVKFEGTLGCLNCILPTTDLTINGDLVMTSTSGTYGDLKSLTVNGSSSLASSMIRTDQGQLYIGPVTLTNDVTVEGAGIDFSNTVDGDGVSPRSLTVNSSDYTYFTNNVGSIVPLNILDVNSAFNIYILGSQMNAVSQSYSNVATILDAPTVLFSNGLNPTTVQFEGTLRCFNCILPTTDVTVNGDFVMTSTSGTYGELKSLTVNGSSSLGSSMIRTDQGQVYFGPVTLTNDVTFEGAGIDFVNSVLGAGYSLTTSTVSPYATVFGGVVSGVNVLTVMGAADINTSSISTSGSQLYNGIVNLGANTVLSSTGGNIHFFDDVVGNGYDLGTNTVSPYSTIFDGNISNVNNLSVMGAATFPNATVITALGVVSFNNALNGPGSVSITAADTQISGNVGGVPPLSAFTVNGPVEFDGGIINADMQTYNGLVTVLSSANPTQLNSSGLIHFLNNIEGPGGLILTAGSVQFDGNVGAGTALSLLDITAPVDFTGAGVFNAAIQNYRGPVTISGASATINASTSVGFFSTVDGPGSLTVNAPITQFSSIVGGTTPLNILTVLNAVILDGTMIVANQEIFQGPATIGPGGALLVSPDVQFLSTIMGPGALAILGNLTASGDISVDNLYVSGTTLFNKGSPQNITTVHGQVYGDTVTLNNDLNILNTGYGQIIFGGGGVVGPAYNLSIYNYSGTHVDGITGMINVYSLTLGGTSGSNLFGTIGVGGVNINFLSIGSFCVNGSCTAVNLDTAQKLTILYMDNFSAMICDATGCRDTSIEMNVPHLLKVADPLNDVCVLSIDGSVSCAGANNEEQI